ncbi:hypothetical protein B0H34DRAFT_397577 [Crassisporium funariophilum]|nr:hypothetical protein B0H34DRAFT_397577 [Crassisporium funariophilum]
MFMSLSDFIRHIAKGTTTAASLSVIVTTVSPLLTWPPVRSCVPPEAFAGQMTATIMYPRGLKCVLLRPEDAFFVFPRRDGVRTTCLYSTPITTPRTLTKTLVYWTDFCITGATKKRIWCAYDHIGASDDVIPLTSSRYLLGISYAD